jgi:hypothetical protein
MSTMVKQSQKHPNLCTKLWDRLEQLRAAVLRLQDLLRCRRGGSFDIHQMELPTESLCEIALQDLILHDNVPIASQHNIVRIRPQLVLN